MSLSADTRLIVRDSAFGAAGFYALCFAVDWWLSDIGPGAALVRSAAAVGGSLAVLAVFGGLFAAAAWAADRLDDL